MAFAWDGGVNNDDPFPGKYSIVGEGPIVVVLIGVSVMNLETKTLEMYLLVDFAKPDPVGMRPREEPEPSGSV